MKMTLSLKGSHMNYKPDILQTIQNEGIALKQRGKFFWALCPFHEEKTPSFKVDLGRQTFFCFGCNAKGDVISFIQQYRGLSYRDALKYLDIKNEKPPKPDKESLKKGKLVKAFHFWCMQYHSSLCDEYRTLNRSLSILFKTPDDLKRFGDLLHWREDIEYQLDLLERGDDQAKFSLFQEAINEF
jgi:hypothetical protein